MHHAAFQESGRPTYFTVEKKVDCFDCDDNNRIKISSALKYMQQVSGDQMLHLGFPIEKLLSEGIAMILWKMCLKVHRRPSCNDPILVGTIPVRAVGTKLQREYLVETLDRERLFSAFSLWLMIDPKTRRILRPSSFPYDWNLRSSVVGEAIGDIPFPRSIAVEPSFMRIPIRYSHIDWNGHVNNTVYAEFVCDALPYEQVVSEKIDTFSICFKKEARRGDVIDVAGKKLNDGHFIAGYTNGSVCFESLVRFRHE